MILLFVARRFKPLMQRHTPEAPILCRYDFMTTQFCGTAISRHRVHVTL